MKKITSLTLGLSFLVMSYTGTMLFLCPKGKIAYWSDWTLLGLSKEQYGDLHITSMFIFLLFGILHIYYNWHPIVSYLKDKTQKISFTTKELLIALAINAAFIFGTLFAIPPVQTIIDINSDIEQYWENRYGTPPYGHAEESKLKVFVRKVGVDLEGAKKTLISKGISFNESDTLKDIAKMNNISPNDIYQILKKAKKVNKSSVKSTKKSSGTNDVPPMLGRKTLQELSQLDVINLEKTLKLLMQKGISDASKQSRMKDIADELDMRPIEVFEIIKK